MKPTTRKALLGSLAVASVLALTLTFAPSAFAGPTDVTNVRIQAGTTPFDSGLYQAEVVNQFEAQYPQYNLQFFGVGTHAAIVNAEAGLGDVVWTHSPVDEEGFVSGGYSYESGGRYVMTSDFVTVGASSDPAGVTTGPQNDVVKAFQEIAAAGAAGHADFVSRGDGSGTNTKELTIWKLTGIPVTSTGVPTIPGSSPPMPPAWYHITGAGQAQNLIDTDACNFPGGSGACYTLADRGTFNNVQTLGEVPDLEIVSQNNNGPGALGGFDLLLNPYHLYAVNPAKVAGVNIDGAMAFLDFMTSPAEQQAIADYPSPSSPAFYPEAYPNLTVGQGVPSSSKATQSVTVSGSALPNYFLDPSLAGSEVDLIRAGDPSTNIATTTVQSDGSYSFSFQPTRTDDYEVHMPQSQDGLLVPNTGFRLPITVDAGHMSVKAVPTLSVTKVKKLKVTVGGTTSPTTDRINAKVQIQYLNGSTWTKLASIAMPEGQASYSTTVSLPSAGTWQIRAHYVDNGAVQAGNSKASQVTVS
jgi:tungstate transport system substrate-binding protein